MALALVVDSYEWPRYDYGWDINFKIYEEDWKTAFNAAIDSLDGFAKIYKRHEDKAIFFRDIAKAIGVLGTVAQVINEIPVTWTTQSSGEGNFKFTETDRPSIPNTHWLEIELRDTATPVTIKRSTEIIRVFVPPSESN